eukprot:CAMPEP_0118807444 /NCGR_PEP_ID=MMETSP1161-20130426/35475_1 /TAXON_ID=249345 /ORGANISM="Picochlorum oklahomensis, Strain CCMP2329" /LENGTH=477 /DNA_ID=CAMNT_0006736809 /DNA_START=266 /DNA_END=1699 /DNA_ORIENTATION=+
MPAGRGGYSGEDKDDNYVECRSVAQIYQYGSADGVECRVCSSTMTSGSWRRGWRIELRLEEEGTLKDEDRPLYANLCNRCGQRWAKLGKVSSPDALKEIMKRSGGFADDGYRKKSKMNDTKIYGDGDSLPVATENHYSGYIMTRVIEDKVTYALFWLLDVRENWLLVALGVDPRSSGHFTYQHAPALSDGITSHLKCTNRSETIKWIKSNFGDVQLLSHDWRSRVPTLSAAQISGMLGANKSSIQQQQQQQHLCQICGCNHPTEDCGLRSTAFSPGLLASNHFAEDSDIRALLDQSIELGPFQNGDSTPSGDLFASVSPHESLPSPSIVFQPENTNQNPGILANDAPQIPMPHQDILSKRTMAHEAENMYIDWTSTLPKSIVEDIFEAWSRSLRFFNCDSRSVALPGMNGTTTGIPQVLTILHQLLACNEVDFELLSKSNISSSIAHLCRHPDATIAARSRQLVEKWRSCAFQALKQ